MIRSLVLVALLAGASPVAAADNSTITRFCMAAFKAAMAQAGKTAPEGMGAETCQCFLREVEQGQGIETAQDICKTEAARKYNL